MDDTSSQGGQEFSLTASKGAKGVGSRTAILNGKTIWSEDDKIYVSSEDGSVTGVLKLNPNSLSEDKTTATFTGFVFGDPAKLAYSVFPAPTNGTIIDLSTIEGGGEVDAPFIGRINTSDDVDVRFEHVCGVAPIVMNGYQGKDIVIKATNNNASVKFLSKLDVTKVDLTDEKPVFIDINKAGQDETESITITSAKGGQMYVPYYLKSSLADNSDNKKIVNFKHNNDIVNNADLTDGFIGKVHATTVVTHTMKEDGTTVQNKPTESEHQTIEGRSTAVVAESQFSSINSSNEQQTSGTSYFNVSALVEVEKETTNDEGEKTKENIVAEVVEVTLPKVVLTENNKDVEKSVEISFTNVIPSTTIVIEEAESTSGSEQQEKSIDNLTVVLPSGTSGEEAKEAVDINMPNTTVTVKSDDGQILLIENMTVSTADNTLVVGADVEIKTLTIKKGNVQVFGKVGVIKRDPHNEDEVTVVTIEKGGIVNAVNGKDKIDVVDKNNPGSGDSENEISVADYSKLKAALNNPSITRINFANNIALEEPLVITRQVQLDLNKKTLSLSENFQGGASMFGIDVVSNGISFYLDNGVVDLTGYTGKMNGFIRTSGNDVRLFMADIDISLGNNFGPAIWMDNDNLTISAGYKTPTITAATAIYYQCTTNKGKYKSTINANINGAVKLVNNNTTINGLNSTFEFVSGHINAPLTISNNVGNIADFVKINRDVVTLGEKATGWEQAGNIGDNAGGEDDNTEASGTPISSFQELQAAIQEGSASTFVLTAPIVLDSPATIDLNRRTLYIDKDIFANHPDATAAIRSTANLTIQNATIYGPELEKADTQRYMIEHIGSASQITTLNITSVTLESRAMEKAVHVKDGYLYSKESKIRAGIAFDLEAVQNTVRGHIDGTSEIANRILFTHNHAGETEMNLNTSGIYIDYGAKINSSLEVDGTYSKNLVLDINRDEKKYYGYDNISGDGWFEATVNYIQYQLATTGVVEISAWNVKKDVTFDVNNQVNDGIIRFYVDSLIGEGTITFNNTNTEGEEQELYLDVEEGSDKVRYTGAFEVQNQNATSEGE